MKKLFVALPVYGSHHPFFVQSLMRLLMAPPCSLVVKDQPGDSLVARARNNLAAEFLKGDCTHLLFIDTDLIFSSEHVARLLEHHEPIVCGLYPKKQKTLAWVLNADLDHPDPDERGLQRIRYAGTGFLMIAREVFERMISAHPEIAYRPDEVEPAQTRWDFFSCGVFEYPDGARRYLSEDWYFCQRALDLGYKVFADTRVVLKHCGDCVYPIEDPFTVAADIVA